MINDPLYKAIAPLCDTILFGEDVDKEKDHAKNLEKLSVDLKNTFEKITSFHGRK